METMNTKKPVFKNYRGVKIAYIVTVLEGNGTEEYPFEEVRYVFDTDELGIKTIGKITPLDSNNYPFYQP